jgi:hypothetical protein
MGRLKYVFAMVGLFVIFVLMAGGMCLIAWQTLAPVAWRLY